MKTRNLAWMIVFFCLFSAVHLVHAQSSEITFYVGGFRGKSFISHPTVLFPEVDAVFNDNVTVGLRYAYFFNNYLAGEVGAGFTPANILVKGSFPNGNQQGHAVIDVDTWVTHANLTVHLVHAPVIPYLTGGVGAVHFRFKTHAFGFLTPSETDFAWNAGGGIKIPVRDDAALRFDGRVYWMEPDFSVQKTIRFTEITGGVSILFDF